jgi:predicted dehydrogenase
MMCDLSTARLKHLKSLYPEVEGATDYKHMLNGVNLDAVVIATNVKTHFPLAKAALLAGKHTFIEKPMAASVEHCQELVDIAQKKGSGPHDRPYLPVFACRPQNQGDHRQGRHR